MIDSKITYTNHSGKTLILQGDDMSFLDIKPLQAYEWGYTLTPRLGGGSMVSNVTRSGKAVQLELRMRGFSRADFLKRMNDLHAVCDADLAAGSPGTLYVGSQYTKCFLAATASITMEPRTGNFATTQVNCILPEPWWTTEVLHSFLSGGSSASNEHGKKYDGRYSYRYGTDMGAERIVNSHYAATPVRLVFYGPATDPGVTIGGNEYTVNASIVSGERIVVDPVTYTVTKIGSDGTATNLFNSRDKEHDIFARLQPGENLMVYSHDFDIDVILIQQRSQLKWVI